jgi:two-component system phosphate regulon sensor histidine kinase PhoR
MLVAGSQEIGSLAEAMNQMASQLNDRILTAARQRNEMEAVLSSMVEGVIAVDTEERVISMNRAAAQLIGVEPAEARGRSIQEVVRNTALQQFVAKTLARHEAVAVANGSCWPTDRSCAMRKGKPLGRWWS